MGQVLGQPTGIPADVFNSLTILALFPCYVKLAVHALSFKFPRCRAMEAKQAFCRVGGFLPI